MGQEKVTLLFPITLLHGMAPVFKDTQVHKNSLI